MRITLVLTPTPDDSRPWQIRLRLALKHLLRAQGLRCVDYRLSDADGSQADSSKTKRAADTGTGTTQTGDAARPHSGDQPHD